MIAGHGDIVGAIADRPDLLFFASGVSNSSEIRESEYRREIELLWHQDHSMHIVYFSSLCIFYSDSRYASHKRTMEDLVKWWFNRYTIMRLGNITWGTNPHTLINFIRNQIRNRQSIEIQDAYRYIVDREEFQHWLGKIPNWSCEINVPGRRMKVRDIVREYCYPWGTYNGPFKYIDSEQELQICV